MIDLNELKKLAEAVPELPWEVTGHTVYALEHDGWRKGIEQMRNRFSFSVQRGPETPESELQAIAEFFQAANPAAVLELIAMALAAAPQVVADERAAFFAWFSENGAGHAGYKEAQDVFVAGYRAAAPVQAQQPVAAAISYWKGPTNSNGTPREWGDANIGRWLDYEPTTLRHGMAIKDRGDPDKRVKFLFDAAPVQPVAVPEGWKPIAPESCPITGRKFWGNIDHPERGLVATYGGPFDTYSIPYLSDDNELRVERFDQDAGDWVEGGEPCGWYSDEQPDAAPAAQGDAKELTDDQIQEVAINYASHVAGDVYDVTKYDCPGDFFNCVRAAIAAKAAS